MKKILLFLTFLTFYISAFCQVGESSDLSYGLKLYEDKIYDVAITQFKVFLEEHSTSISAPKANYFLALSFRELKDKENALRFYQKLILNYPKSEYCEKSLIETAQLHEHQKNYEKAARYYLQIKNYFPKSTKIPENSYKAVKIFFAIKKYEEAKENIALLKRNYPVNSFTLKALILLSRIHSENGENSAAERNYREISRIAKTDDVKSSILYNHGICLLSQNKITEAKVKFLAVIKKYKKQSENYFPALIEYTHLMMDEKKFKEIDDLIDSKVKIPQEFKAELLNIDGEIEFFKGNYQVAEKKFKEALQEKYDINTKFKIAFCQEKLKNFEKAGELLLASVKTAPEEVEKKSLKIGILKAAELFSKAKNYNKTISAYKLYLDLFKKDSYFDKIHFFISKAYFDFEKFDYTYQSLKLFIRDYRESPFIDDAVYLSAEAALKLKKYKEAYFDYRDLTQKYPASKFYPLAKNNMQNLVKYKLKGDDLIDKIADLSGRNLIEDDKTTLLLDWGKFYYYEMKDYVKAIKYLEMYNNILQKQNKEIDAESKFIYASSIVNIPNASKKKLEMAFDLYTAITTDSNSIKNKSKWFIGSSISRIELAERLEANRETATLLRTDMLMTALKDKIDDEKGTILYYACQDLFSTEKYLEFQTLSSKFLTAYPSSEFCTEILYKTGISFEKSGNMEKALEAYKKLNSIHNNSRYDLEVLKKLPQLTSQSIDQKLSYLEKIKNLYYYTEDGENINEAIAELYLNNNKPRKALKIYIALQQKLDKGFINPRWNFSIKNYAKIIGDIFLAADDFSKAEYYYKRQLSSTKDEINRLEILNNLSIIYQKSGNMSALESNLKDIASFSKGKHNLAADIALADIEFNKGNYNKALKKYQSVLKNKPENKIDVQAKIIKTLFRQNKITAADKKIKLFRKQHEDKYDKKFYEPLFYLEKSNAFLELKDYTKALKGYEALLDDYEESKLVSKAMYGQGRVFFNIGKKEKAFEIWKELIEKHPEDDIAVETNYSLGSIYINREQFDKAIASLQYVVNFKKAHRLKKFAYKYLIDLYQKLGFNDASARSIREYVSLFPDEPDVFQKRIEIGNIYQRNEEYDQALDYFNRLLYEAKGDDEAAVQFFIAETYMMKENYRRAISEFLKVKYLIKTSSPYEWGLTSVYKTALCYEQLGEYQKALNLLEEIAKNHAADRYGKQAKKIIERINEKKEP